MARSFAAVLVIAALAFAGANAQGAYKSILSEIQQWQQQNPNACGHDVSTCGVAKMVENFHACNAFRVVNGCPVDKPLTVGWQAALMMSGGGLCSGVLVGPQHILTAGHCLHEMRSASDIKVFLGTNNIRSGGQKLGAQSFGVHPNFDISDIHSDVALVKLDRPVQMDEANGIRTACLPPAGYTVPNDKLCVLAGFGTNSPNGRGGGSGEMRYTVLQQQPHRDCAMYGKYDPSVSFCALGDRNGQGTDSCNGDSGSSLLCKDDSGRWISTGVVSYGAANCGSVPGVYADVAKLGLTVSARPAAQDKCKTASDGKKPPVQPTTSPAPSHGKNPSTGPTYSKKPTYSGSTDSISSAIQAHGCRNNNECQSNICRMVALCTSKSNQFEDLFNTISNDINNALGSGKFPSGGSFSFSTSQVHHHGGKFRRSAAAENKQKSAMPTAMDILKLSDKQTLAARQLKGAKPVKGANASLFNNVNGGLGSLFAKRSCQIHQMCSAEQAQQQSKNTSPMVVAMFNDYRTNS